MLPTDIHNNWAPQSACQNREGKLLPLPRSLKGCTMSADCGGLSTAGGTADAYGLLTQLLYFFLIERGLVLQIGNHSKRAHRDHQ